MKRKYLFTAGVLALALAFGFTLTACGDGDDGGNITYTVAATGSPDTTAITFTFSDAVTGLVAGDITVANGTGSATKGSLTGSGTSWSLGITAVSAGTVTVSIGKAGIASGNNTVTIVKGESGGENPFAGTTWTYTHEFLPEYSFGMAFTATTWTTTYPNNPGSNGAGTYTYSGNWATLKAESETVATAVISGNNLTVTWVGSEEWPSIMTKQ